MVELSNARKRLQEAEEMVLALPEDIERRREFDKALQQLNELEARHTSNPFWFMNEAELA